MPAAAQDRTVSADEDEALLRLLASLAARDYRFVTTTPASHARVIGRPGKAVARSIADVFGWSLPFAPGLVPRDQSDELRAAAMLDEDDGTCRSRVRVSSVGDLLFLHSAFPTTAAGSVFFGPDSYRFADAIRAELEARPLGGAARILDLGTGSGVGAIVAGRLSPGAAVTATDINPAALRFARINARAAGVTIAPVLTDGAGVLAGAFDLILINPPYLLDAEERAYRHGGGRHGAELPLRLVREALPLLAAGGRLVLYTGSAIVDGQDAFGAALARLVAEGGCAMTYRETDPDVFGEELDAPAYQDVDRIALVSAVLRKPA